MKKALIINSGFFLALLFIVSCKEDYIAVPKFDVQLDGGYTYKVGQEITFNFTGEAQNIVFWSGEKGRNYANRNRTEEKGIQTLQVKTLAGVGTQNDHLSFLFSKDFNGTYDAANIALATWTDITAKSLARNGTYSSSSNGNITSQVVSKAFDDDVSTSWKASGTFANQWLTVNFSKATTFDEVVLSEASALTSGFRLEYSVDGTIWQTVYTGTTIGTSPKAFTFNKITANYMRVYFTSGISVPSISEFGVYEYNKVLLSYNPISGTTGPTLTSIANISEYADSENKPIYFAFKNSSAFSSTLKARTWTVNEFLINNTLSDGTVNTLVPTFQLAGFKVINVLDETKNWTLSPARTSMTSASTNNIGDQANEDWAISAPIKINNVSLVDYGVPLSSINTLTSQTFYKYKYNAAGTYFVTFYASNQDVNDKKYVEKQFIITILP